MPWQNRPGISPKKGEDTTTQPKTQLTKPTAGALKAAEEFFFTAGIDTSINDVLIPKLAHVIDRYRETGMAGLLEAAEAVVAEFIKMSGRIEETPLNIQQLEQAIGKAEGREEREKR